MYRKLVAGSVSAVLVGSLLAAAPPAAAQGGLDRPVQPFDSAPVEPVTGAGSAFADAAPDWSGRGTDPVGGPGSGDWTATDLSLAGAWTQGGSSGAFTYSYGMRVPPAEGPVPDVGLSYSSAFHDGLTSGTNNQASWVGDGWSFSPSFIERTYLACDEDEGGNQGDEPTGDLCWEEDSPSLTLSLDGVSMSLVRDGDTGQWRTEQDAGWRIEKAGSPAGPGSPSSERWVVTTTDGTRHSFASVSSSRWTVPVFGNHAGEPCFEPGDFEGSRCHQAYRWMLDTSVDVHGNLVRYTYRTASGRYAPAGSQSSTVSYVREGWLERIEYGLRDGSSAPAAARVEFTVADRCLSDCRDGDGDPKEKNWPDTPWDLHCESGQDCETYSPVFFSTKRLTRVATYVGDGMVDSWALRHEFKDYGDDEQVVLWLASVRHTGHVGGTATTPPVEFGGTFLENRVDTGEPWPGIWRPRLTSIKNETGGVTTINYSEPDCGGGDLPAHEHQNGRLCYPAMFTPEGLWEPARAWFHKYVVRSVAESDATGGGDVVWTFYDYSTAGGGTTALWAWNDAEFVPKKHRMWNEWRGFAQVVTRVGDPADPGPQQRSRARYFRGLDGDRLPGGGKRSVDLTDSHGNTATDHRSLTGLEWETATFDDTTRIGSTTTWYRWSRTAARRYEGGKVEAFQVGPERVDTHTRLSGSAWRHTRTDTSYDSFGRIVAVDERGDTGRSGDERCLRTTYADNADVWLRESVATVEAVAVGCGETARRPQDVITAARAYYDGRDSHTAAPVRGLLTRVDVLDGWDGGPVYVMAGESTYDGLGREVTATDALGETTTIAYTPAGAGPVTRVTTTNPAGHVTISRLDPAWGAVIERVDANQARTVAEFDPLGRRTAVWLPERESTRSPSMRVAYDVSQTAPTAVTTESLTPNGSYLTEITLYDSLLRERQVQAQTYGGRLISQTVYDSYGQVRFASDPVFNNQSGPTGELVWVSRTNDVARTEYGYDGAGRVSREAFVVKGQERWRTSYRYGGHDDYWMTTTIAPQGGTSTATLEDARGNTVQLRQFHQRAAGGEFDTTKYGYNRHGRLERVTDPAGNTWTFDYDLRGRKAAVHDPDTGTTTSRYNVAGQVISTTDANGAVLSYAYDVLGRPTHVWEGQVGDGELLVERTYDGARNGVGLPHTATRYTDGQAWQTTYRKYNLAGQPQQIYTYLPEAAGALAGSYWQSFTYHDDGSLATSNAVGVGGLSREPMNYFYNDLGQPTRVTSNSDDFGDGHVYVDEATYSPYGQLLQRRLGDPDEVGGTSGQVWQTWVYEEGTGRPAEFYFDKDSAGGYDATTYGVAALSYQYDPAGNILSITDNPVHTSADLDPETQCFHYDHLRRLTDAWAQAGAGDCAGTPSGGVVGGPGAYWSSYEYDQAGNRVSETRWQPGAGDTTRSYRYQPDAPHTLAEVTGSDPVALTYDAAGYTTVIDRGGQADTLAWNAAGRLDTIETAAGTTRFYDDAAGNRILREDPNGDLTAWVAGYELTYTVATGTIQAARYYQHGGDTIGVRGGAGDILWLAGDHHGTNQWIVNGDTLTTKVRRFDPFGNERGNRPDAWPDQRGFVGGITSHDLGLTTIGAREYDPTLGRFLSRDPIADFTDPQQINGYSYASHNPVVFSDPTGLRETECSSEPCRRSGAGRAGKPGKSAKGGGGARSGGGGAGRKGGGTGHSGRGGGGARSGGGHAGSGRDSGVARGGSGVGGAIGGKGGPVTNGRMGPGGLAGRGPGIGRGPSGRGVGPAAVNNTRLQQAILDALGWTQEQLENYLQSQLDGMQMMWDVSCVISWCPGYVRDHPPGAYGLCINASGNYGAHGGVSGCIWYTEEDGIVLSTSTEWGGGCCGVGATVSSHLTSAASADELAGGASFFGISAGELAVAGLSGSYSHSGEWTVGGEVGVGAGTPVGAGGGGSNTWAVPGDEVPWDMLDDMIDMIPGNPLTPWGGQPLGW